MRLRDSVVLVFGAAVLLAAAGCDRPKAILFVNVAAPPGSELLGTDALRVTVHHDRLGTDVPLRYPGSPLVAFPTSFTVLLRGDIEDGDTFSLAVVAEAAGDDVLEGLASATAVRGDTTYVDVTLAALTVCGDDAIDPPVEECDGTALDGNDCLSLGLGFIGGALACDTNCSFDTSGCTLATCGDGDIDAGEDCDGAVLGGQDCTTIAMGFDGGTLACDATCSFDTNLCTLPSCGDGNLDVGEDCDGADFGGQDCTDVGMYSGGTLACTTGCNFDFAGCNGPPSEPVNRRPLNNSYVGTVWVASSLRPTFAWDSATVAGGVPITYDLEYSSSATFAAGLTTAVTGIATTSFQPATGLAVDMAPPVGTRYFWHVRACAGSACSTYSTTWRVNVGRSDRDLNGDGYADVAVGTPKHSPPGLTEAGRVQVYFGGGGTTFDFATPEADLVHTAGSDFDWFGSALEITDLDGDGFADLLVGIPGYEWTGPDWGRVYLYLGGAGATFDAVSDASFLGSGDSASRGRVVASAGDVNGDGFNDVLMNDAGILLFLGAPFIDSTSDATFTEPGAAGFGDSAAGAGDVNGDGYADVIIGAPNSDGSGVARGTAHVYLGSTGPVDVAADLVLEGVADNDPPGQFRFHRG